METRVRGGREDRGAGRWEKQHLCHPVPLPTQDRQRLQPPCLGTDGDRHGPGALEGKAFGSEPLNPGLLMITERDGGGEAARAGGGSGDPRPLPPRRAHRAQDPSLHPPGGGVEAGAGLSFPSPG